MNDDFDRPPGANLPEGPGDPPLSTPSPPPGRFPASALIVAVFVLAVVGVAAAAFLVRLRPKSEAPAVAPPPAESPVVADTSFVPPSQQIITAADLPGFDTEGLTDRQRLWLYHQARREKCTCGCGLSIAACRQEDMPCPYSPGRAKEMVEEARARQP